MISLSKLEKNMGSKFLTLPSFLGSSSSLFLNLSSFLGSSSLWGLLHFWDQPHFWGYLHFRGRLYFWGHLIFEVVFIFELCSRTQIVEKVVIKWWPSYGQGPSNHNTLDDLILPHLARTWIQNQSWALTKARVVIQSDLTNPPTYIPFQPPIHSHTTHPPTHHSPTQQVPGFFWILNPRDYVLVCPHPLYSVSLSPLFVLC